MEGPRNIILYHYPCPDGAFSAYAVHLSGLKNVTYVPARTGSRNAVDLTQFSGSSNLYLLDYGGPNVEFLLQACKLFENVYLLDHHKTTVDIIQSMRDFPPNLHTEHVTMSKTGRKLLAVRVVMKPKVVVLNVLEDP